MFLNCGARQASLIDRASISFDLAERFQTPVFVMSDLDLGMNIWMSDPFTYPEGPIDRALRAPAVLGTIAVAGRATEVIDVRQLVPAGSGPAPQVPA